MSMVCMRLTVCVCGGGVTLRSIKHTIGIVVRLRIQLIPQTTEHYHVY